MNRLERVEMLRFVLGGAVAKASEEALSYGLRPDEILGIVTEGFEMGLKSFREFIEQEAREAKVYQESRQKEFNFGGI